MTRTTATTLAVAAVIPMTTPSRLPWVYTTAVTPMTTQWPWTAAAGRAVILSLVRWPVL
jgi:hypothetical protein